MWHVKQNEKDKNLLETSIKICTDFIDDNFNDSDFNQKYTDDFTYLENSTDNEDEIVDIEANCDVKKHMYHPITFYYPKDLKYIIKKTSMRQFIDDKQHILHPIGSMLPIPKPQISFKKTPESNITQEEAFISTIAVNHSYMYFFNENQISQLLFLACILGYYELVQIVKIKEENTEYLTNLIYSYIFSLLTSLKRDRQGVRSLKEFIAMNIDVNNPSFNENCTALMKAAKAGHVNIVRLLLSHKANVNAHSITKNSPLIYGCVGGHQEVVRVLLEAGANVEHYNEDGCTPLKAAAKMGHVSIAKILLEHGAKCNTHSKKFKESALTLASYKGHLEMVRLLLEADKHETNDIQLALITASINGHLEVARLLLDTGARVNMLMDNCESPLLLAALEDHTELVKLLLDRGAKTTEINSEGYNPLMQAARAGHVKMVVLLLSRNAYIDYQNEETAETALTLACNGGFLKVVKVLIKAGANINLGQLTALMIAAREGHLNIVQYLLDCGADVKAQTFEGNTALMYACENGHTDIAKLLLQFNAKLEHKSVRGVTPLMNACAAGHFDTVQFLISKGANVNCHTIDNQTPLTLASSAGHIAIVALILDYGANRNYKFEDNFTTIMRATTCNQPHIITLLLEKLRIFRTNKYKYDMDNEFIFKNYFFDWKNATDKTHQSVCKWKKQVKTNVLKMADKDKMKEIASTNKML